MGLVRVGDGMLMLNTGCILHQEGARLMDPFYAPLGECWLAGEAPGGVSAFDTQYMLYFFLVVTIDDTQLRMSTR